MRVLLCALLLAPAPLWAATYHVAQTDAASDDGPGDEARPWRTISHAAKVMQAGDTVIIHAGTYREWVNPRTSGTPDAPIRFVGAEGEEVVLTGADVLTEWKRVEGAGPIHSFAPWTARFQVSTTKDGQPVYHHPGDEKHKLIGRTEQVIVDDELLDQVLAREELKPGAFFADLEQQVLYVWLADGSDPREHEVQACTRGWVFGRNPWRDKEPVHHIQLSNVTIRYAANHAQRGALWVGGDGWRLENIVVEWTNGNGVSVGGQNLFVRNLISRHNGQMGMGGSPQGGFLEDIQLLHNNRKGYSAGWEAGGMKFAHARDTVLSRVIAAHNDGPGIWFDIDNRDCVIRQCVCHDNTGSGMFIEISGGFIIANNLCYRNGVDGGWGASGILIGESNDCIVEHNVCVGNDTGIGIREQGPRTFPGRGGEVAYWVRNFVCRYNICALNRKYQFGLWSDNVFFGPHPSPNVGLKGTPLDPAEQSYTIDHNLYFAGEGQGLVLWGCPWRNRHQEYPDLAQFTAEQGHDEHTMAADPLFADVAQDDFRLQPDSPAHEPRIGLVSPPAGLTALEIAQ